MEGSYLEISPDKELEFRRPLTQTVKRILTVRNTHPDSPIVFKVKTTAPKQYCVRPNSGRIPPDGSVEVQVLLQAMREDPPPDFKCKDKFLVQAIKVPSDVMNLKEGPEFNTRVGELWTQAESLKKGGAEDVIAEKKLRCAFLPADGTTSTAAAPAPALVNSEVRPAAAIVPPLPRAATSAAASTKFNAEDALSRTSTTRSDFTDAESSLPRSSTVSSSRPSSMSSTTTASTITSSKPSSSAQFVSLAPSESKRSVGSMDPDKEREYQDKIKTLQDACEGYKTEIERINSLRQRRAETGRVGDGIKGTSGGAGGMMTAQGQQAALSMPMVALIALIAFFLGGWLF